MALLMLREGKRWKMMCVGDNSEDFLEEGLVGNGVMGGDLNMFGIVISLIYVYLGYNSLESYFLYVEPINHSFIYSFKMRVTFHSTYRTFPCQVQVFVRNSFWRQKNNPRHLSPSQIFRYSSNPQNPHPFK